MTTLSENNHELDPNKNINIATAMVVNPNLNYHFVGNNSNNTNDSCSNNSTDSITLDTDPEHREGYNYSFNECHLCAIYPKHESRFITVEISNLRRTRIK